MEAVARSVVGMEAVARWVVGMEAQRTISHRRQKATKAYTISEP